MTGYIKTLKMLIAAMMIAVVATLAACSGAEEPQLPPRQKPSDPEPCSRFILFGSRGATLDWLSVTGSRAESPAIVTEMPQSMGVWGYSTSTSRDEVFCNTPLYNMTTNLDAAVADNVSSTWLDDYENNWGYYNNHAASQIPIPWERSTAEREVKYKFFGYAPYMPDASATAESFVGFKDVTLRGLNRVSAVDYLAGDRVIQYTAATNPADNPVQTIKMTHLYSRAQFRFKLGERYDSLRTVVVKKVELINLMGQTVDLTISFNLDGSGEYMPTYYWNVTSTVGAYDELQLADEGPLTLNRDQYQAFASVYLFPYNGYSAFTMRVTYDVYDKVGQLLREDESVVNTVTLNLLAGTQGLAPGAKTLAPGYYYNVNILVKPTFLYVLSDNDMGSDCAIVM